MILFVMTKTLDRHAGLLWGLFGDVSEHDSVHRKSVWRQTKQIDHCLWVAANSAYGDYPEAGSAGRSHDCRHRDSGVADRGQNPFKTALKYLYASGFLDAQACLIEVYDYRDEHRRLRNPWLAASNFGYARSALLIAHDNERY